MDAIRDSVDLRSADGPACSVNGQERELLPGHAVEVLEDIVEFGVDADHADLWIGGSLAGDADGNSDGIVAIDVQTHGWVVGVDAHIASRENGHLLVVALVHDCESISCAIHFEVDGSGHTPSRRSNLKASSEVGVGKGADGEGGDGMRIEHGSFLAIGLGAVHG
jgi:hypothetical protein